MVNATGPRTRFMVAAAVIVGAAAPLLVATPAAAVPNLMVVSTSSGWSLATVKAVGASCPLRWSLLGGGADVANGVHSVHVSGINLAPLVTTPNTNWTTAHVDKLGYGQSWSLTGYAICGTNLSGYSVAVADTGASPGNTYASATAHCPPGKKVIGAGGRDEGKVDMVLDTIQVWADLSAVTVESFGLDGQSTGAHAYAVCVDPVAGQQVITVSSSYTSSDKILSADCPAGTYLHGLGGGITGGYGQVYIDRLAPHGTNPPTGADIDLREDADGDAGTWQATVQAICAD